MPRADTGRSGVRAARWLLIASLALVGVVRAGEGLATGKLTLARLKYGGGGDWYNDPDLLPNLCRELSRRADIAVNEQQAIVSLEDDNLFSYPVVFMTGHGEIKFSDAELQRLRTYLTHGGFLYADDDYGMDKPFRRELKRAFPDKDLIELPFTHPIYHIIYEFPHGLPKIHEHDGKPPQAFGLFHDGRLIVLYTYETNISDGWAAPDVHHDPPQKRETALQMGVNIIAFALSQ